MTALEREYQHFCVFCGRPFLTPFERSVFCSRSCQRRELEAIWMLERTTPSPEQVQ